MSRWLPFVALMLCALPLSAQNPAVSPAAEMPSAEDTSNLYARKSLQAVRLVDIAPAVDGKLDDPVWQLAPAGSGFIQTEPRPGQPASQATEVRVVYDDDAVYVAARMFDSQPDSMVAQLARRDNEVYSEWVYVAFDSYFDRRTAFAFGINPRGVKVDVLVFDDTNDDESWDAVWDAAARTDSLGWTAEFRIPLSQLRYSTSADPDAETLWGFNVLRNVARHNEESWWSPIRRDASALVSAFGDLRGMAGLKSPKRVEVLPYSMSRLVRAPGSRANPFYDPSDASFGAGADVKLGVTSEFTLTGTVNPDFGQVEADPAVVNLTAFETFFQEKRPFFVEGFDIFRVGIGVGDGDGSNEGLFYSRRIGRAPQGDVPAQAEHADFPESATILGAAKLSGKTKTGWSIGALSALTGRETAEFVDAQGDRHVAAVEPLTHYGIARVVKDFEQGQSALGGIFTATNRDVPDELRFLRANAYVGGLTGRKRWQNGNYQLTGWLVGTHVNGDTAAINATQRSSARYFQRPDNDYTDYDPTRRSLSGAGFGAEFFKQGGGNWRYAGLLNVRSPGFEVNDLGFMPNADRIFAVAFVGYRQQEPTRHFNDWSINVNQWTGWNFGGERNSFGANINGNFELRNTADFWWGVNREQAGLSESATRGGPALMRPGSINLHGGYDSDERKPVNWWLSLNYNNEDDTNGRAIGVHPGLRIRASDRIEVRVMPDISWHRRAWQYITGKRAGGADHYIFGELNQVTTSLTTRFSYTFSPDLSLQLYAQPFISAGDYTTLREVARPRAERFDERFRSYTASQLTYDAAADSYAIDRDGDGATDFMLANPDFNFRAFRSNLVLRWEYRPGSALFFVWSQGRESSSDLGDYDLGRDSSRLFRTRATNVLLVKATYWLGL